MFFTVTADPAVFPTAGRSQAFLIPDRWDDWFKFRTAFTLVIFDANGNRHVAGSVKIGQAGLLGLPAGTEPMPDNARFPRLPDTFDHLDATRFFALGQNEDYYATLNALDPALKQTILVGLCDCAFDLAIYERHQQELVMGDSLLRFISAENLKNRLHRLANGDAVLTKYEFEFSLPLATDPHSGIPLPPTTFPFRVTPNSNPPTNVHVLVGRNGAGKTRSIQCLINTILERPTDKAPMGNLRQVGDSSGTWTFAGLVSVSFSAFDDYAPPIAAQLKIPAEFVGLRKQVEVDGEAIAAVKLPEELASDFAESLRRCSHEPKRTRWIRAVQTLASDPLFGEIEVENLLNIPDQEWNEKAESFFKRLSSGHAIVLLTTTRLVELVDERTLVVLDEPEGHLHPPLLSAFIRTVADLLVARNGLALISTHSPVVLQEVPRSCVSILRRTRHLSTIERPGIETFGESTGVLTREVFGLEVTNSGFHRLVTESARQPGSTYESVEEDFGHQLGTEARALARSLVHVQRRN